jgi:hypothetical protein
MNWDYIAGFFDGEGNIHIFQIKKDKKIKSIAIQVRLYNNQKNVLFSIREFLGYGNIYQKKQTGVFELNIIKKDKVKHFLENIQDKVILKKSQTDFLLNNYNFIKGFSNIYFDIDLFRSFINRKNVKKTRINHTLTAF